MCVCSRFVSNQKRSCETVKDTLEQNKDEQRQEQQGLR